MCKAGATAGMEIAPLETGRFHMGLILLILVILFLVGSVPAWPYSRRWGYYPSGFFSLVFIILLILLLTGQL
jgi:uncharacterized protein DUF3309